MDDDRERAAWAEDLARQAPWLHLLVVHLAGRALRARVEVEDLVQEVYLRALGPHAPVREDDEAGGEVRARRMLALLAREVVIDAARALRAIKRGGGLEARRIGSSAPSGMAASALAGTATGPFTAAARGERNRELVESYLRLAPEHRRVIGLRQLEGRSAAETARRMGRSESAIHSLYRRALQAWSRELGGEPLS